MVSFFCLLFREGGKMCSVCVSGGEQAEKGGTHSARRMRVRACASLVRVWVLGSPSLPPSPPSSRAAPSAHTSFFIRQAPGGQ
jgi:hypothetical protein